MARPSWSSLPVKNDRAFDDDEMNCCREAWDEALTFSMAPGSSLLHARITGLLHWRRNGISVVDGNTQADQVETPRSSQPTRMPNPGTETESASQQRRTRKNSAARKFQRGADIAQSQNRGCVRRRSSRARKLNRKNKE